MNIERLLVIHELQKIEKESMVDSSDIMNYHTTAIIFFMCILTISFKQYIQKPIQCWVPAEFARSWESYAENYCWVQPTYFVSYDGAFPTEKEREQTFNYYQWVPFVLLMQLCLCLVPYFMWKTIANTVGINFQNLMISIKAVKQTNYQKGFEESICQIAEKMVKLFNNRRIDEGKPLKAKEDEINKKTCNPKCRYFLFLSYLSIKVVFMITAILQIVIMKYFIGNISLTFGVDIIRNIINGSDWKTTHFFPRISGCDVTIRRSGQPIKYSFLCVLPVNMVNEKIYIFLWFWMVFCIFTSLVSLMIWLYRICSQTRRRRLIYKLLLNIKIDTENMEEINKDINKFMNDFLKVDGIFIIDMITRRYGDVVTSSIIEKVFLNFQESEKLMNEEDNKQWI